MTPIMYPEVSAPVAAPVGVSAASLQNPMVVGVPSTVGATVCTNCGAAPQGYGMMQGVDIMQFSTWPYPLKVATGVAAVFGVYKLVMR